MTPYHDTRASRLTQGHTQLTDWDAASIAGAVNGIQVITGILLQHQFDTEFDSGDELLKLNSASVSGLLEAVNGLSELVELRLGFGVSRVLRQKTHDSIETDLGHLPPAPRYSTPQ